MTVERGIPPTAVATHAAVRARTAVAVAGWTTAMLLALAAVLWASSMRRDSGDTWIGLAAGRLICQRGYFDFPVHDEFTFTHDGRVWANQNWLVHVLYWLIYSRWCPSGIVVLKLLLNVVIWLCLWGSAWLTCRERSVSMLAASGGLLGFGMLIDMRPNHVGIACVALLVWLLLATKYRSGRPLWLLPVLMTFWGNAHGSFLMGFGLIGVFLACELGQGLWGRSLVLAPYRRLGWLVGATLVSLVLVGLSSPYGRMNFTHPLIVMTGSQSKVFQGVFEWRSPVLCWLQPTWTAGFWILVVISMVVWIAAVATRGPQGRHNDLQSGERPCARFDLTELVLAGIGLWLALDSLRFIPVFVVMSMPLTAKLLARVSSGTGESGKPTGDDAFNWRSRRMIPAATAMVNAGLLMWLALFQGPDVWESFRPRSGEPYGRSLFNTHIDMPRQPVELLAFLRKYELSGRVLNDWVWGGYLMFAAPEFKLYIDGRSQALYPAEFYHAYWTWVRQCKMSDPSSTSVGLDIHRKLLELGVDLVIGSRTRAYGGLHIMNHLLRTGLWEPLVETAEGGVLVRKASRDPTITRLMRKYYAGLLDWPDTAYGWKTRGHVLQTRPIPDHEGALEALKRSVELKPYAQLYQHMLVSWRYSGRTAEALAYYEQQRERVARMCQSPCEDLEEVRECLPVLEKLIAALRSGGAAVSDGAF